VTPDLTALGKVIGGGLPLGAVVGRRELMNVVWPLAARDAATARRGSAFPPGMAVPDRSGPYVLHGGTYSGMPMALAAGLAVLDLLENEGGWQRLEAAGERMRGALRELFARRGQAAQVIGTGAAFDFYFTEEPIRSLREVWASDLAARRALDYSLLGRGIYNSPVHRFHLSLSHSDADLECTLAEIEGAVVKVFEAAHAHSSRG